MGDLDAALAFVTGLGTTSVEDELKAAGVLNDLGMVDVAND